MGVFFYMDKKVLYVNWICELFMVYYVKLMWIDVLWLKVIFMVVVFNLYSLIRGKFMFVIVNDIVYLMVCKKIDLFIDNFVNIMDEIGEFLFKLEDGCVIDIKGWGDWEWIYGIGLYGLLKYWDMMGESKV